MNEKGINCDYHLAAQARWYFVDCRHFLCDLCIEERRLGRKFKAYVHSFQDCRGRCIPLTDYLKLARHFTEAGLSAILGIFLLLGRLACNLHIFWVDVY